MRICCGPDLQHSLLLHTCRQTLYRETRLQAVVPSGFSESSDMTCLAGSSSVMNSNSASVRGGALFVDFGSIVSVDGNVCAASNTAPVAGFGTLDFFLVSNV
jgi:putative cofactor-binding repeat protein